MREVRIRNVQTLTHNITTLRNPNFPSQHVHTTTKVIFQSVARLFEEMRVWWRVNFGSNQYSSLDYGRMHLGPNESSDRVIYYWCFAESTIYKWHPQWNTIGILLKLASMNPCICLLVISYGIKYWFGIIPIVFSCDYFITHDDVNIITFSAIVVWVKSKLLIH